MLEDIIRGRVKEIHDTEYKLRKEYKNENERKEKLEIELSRIKDNLLSDLFEKIASYKLVPSKDSSSKVQKIIDFLVAVFMNANNITDINNLPIKLREMLLNGNKGKLER